MILLSIIIPVYKTQEFFKKCVESVLDQDYQEIEVILVNDGSPDGCPALCNEYQKKDSRVKAIHQKNKGLAAARNTGIRAATGNYLTFLDNDDWWNPEISLKEIINHIEKKVDTEMFLFNSINYHPENGLMKRNDQSNFLKFKDRSVDKIYKEMVKDGNVHEAAYRKIFKSEFITKNMLFFQDGLSIEDSEWNFRIMRCVEAIDIIDLDLLIYRSQREGSITNIPTFNHLFDMALVLQQSVDYWNINSYAPIRRDCELSQCAYLWCVILSGYTYLNVEEKRIIKEKLQALSYLSDFSSSLKTKLTFGIFFLAGFNITSKLLRLYVLLNKKYLFSSKKVEIKN